MYRQQSRGYSAPIRTRRTTVRRPASNLASQAGHQHHDRHQPHSQHTDSSQHQASHMQHARQGSQDHRSNSTQQPCQICSYTQPYPAEQKRVFHTHFSSLRHRELTGVEGTDNSYLCPSCKSSHAPNPEDRIKLVISDSSLHKFFDLTTRRGSGYPGDMLHVDLLLFLMAA